MNLPNHDVKTSVDGNQPSLVSIAKLGGKGENGGLEHLEFGIQKS